MGVHIGYPNDAGSGASVVVHMLHAYNVGGGGKEGCAHALKTRIPFTLWREQSRRNVLEACGYNITTLCYYVIWREWKKKRDLVAAYADEIVEEIEELTGTEGLPLPVEVMHAIS